MTNEELKKKIKEILRKRMTELLGSCHTDEIPLTEEGAEAILFYADEFADALIAAGLRFGNKHRIFVENAPIPTTCVDNNFYLVPNTPPTIKQLYGDEEVEQIVKERDEYKHRAEVAEKAFSNCLENFLKFQYEKNCCLLDKFFLEEVNKKCLQQAEKELHEERKDD